MNEDDADATLIVGAGTAGLTVAARLRELGDTRPIRLVGAEPDAPYERPPLSKQLLIGPDPVDPTLRLPAWFADHDIDLVVGDAVTDLQHESGTGRAETASGRVIPFARLALATGATPHRLPELPHALVLRSRRDAAHLLERLTLASRVVVIGGGFLGLEVAAAARARGLEVIVLEAGDRLMARAVSPVISATHRAWHEAAGTRILLGVNDADVMAVAAEPAQGTVVVTCVGAQPDPTLAERLALEVVGGIDVNERCLTSDGTTVAAGDCARVPVTYVDAVDLRLRLESVDGAEWQGRRAAATLLGVDEPTRHVPWFWSDQGALGLQIVGLPALAEESVVRGDPESGQGFSIIHFRDGRLVASECVNRPADHVVVKRALAAGRSFSLERRDELADPAKQLRGLLA